MRQRVQCSVGQRNNTYQLNLFLGKVTIIGGGVNGVCSAYYLRKAGYQVQIIDPNFSEEGTSYGNAGMVVPSHFIPMASPGIIAKGLRWMFDSSSPFYIKPRINLQFAHWLWRFTRSCTAQNVTENQELIWKYNELSKAEYRNIAETEKLSFDFQEKGLLMLYQSEKSQKEEIEIGEQAEKLGLQVEVLDQNGVQQLNPETTVDVLGGVYYPGDAHLYSNHFMGRIINALEDLDVEMIHASVTSLRKNNHSVESVSLSNGEEREVEELVVSAGAWSAQILRKLGISLLLEDGKGYSITQNNLPKKPTIPSILTDEKVAITPMGDHLRITGTLEISGRSPKINYKRVEGFLRAVPRYFPEVHIPENPRNADIWTGFRPLSYDGVPYVGRSEKIGNVIVATGHGMMGMSLGPATGKLVSEIVEGKNPSLNLGPMRIER